MGGSQGPGREARGTVCITPEADCAFQSRGSAAVSLAKSAVVFHLRLFIVIVASAERVLHARYCALSWGVKSPPFYR